MSVLKHTIHERVCGGEVKAELFVLGFPEPFNFRAKVYVDNELVNVIDEDCWTDLVFYAEEEVDCRAEKLQAANVGLPGWGWFFGESPVFAER